MCGAAAARMPRNCRTRRREKKENTETSTDYVALHDDDNDTDVGCGAADSRCPPLVDDEDLKSSTESTISTSLNQSIASLRNCEQVHTSVLNLIFQQANVDGVGEFVEMKI